MKLNLGKVTLNKIILYLLIAIFLVLTLQYAMAYFKSIQRNINTETFKLRKKKKKSKITLPKITLPKIPLTVPKSELDACKNQLINKDKIISELQKENSQQKDEIGSKNQTIDDQAETIKTLESEVDQVQGIGVPIQESFAPYN